MPSLRYVWVLERFTHSHVFVVMRLPCCFAPGDSPGEGRYERENPRGGRPHARIPLAQGSAPAAGQPFMFAMASSSPAGTFTFTYEPGPWTLLPYRESSGHYVVNGCSTDIAADEYEIVNRIMTAPENLTKAIPVVFEIFVGGSNDANLATGLADTGSGASAGITEVCFLKRTSASLDAPMELIDHEAAVAAGIIEVTGATHLFI
jgi:hypothetical protein